MSFSATLFHLVTTVVLLLPVAVVAQGLPSGEFTLTTQFREGEDECFEGNQVDGAMGGAAFMDRCQNVSGQIWQAIPEENGHFRLTTRFRAPFNECLEGNQVNGSMNGAAFMDRCQNVSGQLWRLIPVDGDYFRLTTLFREEFDECLEGNEASGDRGGARIHGFLSKCQRPTLAGRTVALVECSTKNDSPQFSVRLAAPTT